MDKYEKKFLGLLAIFVSLGLVIIFLWAVTTSRADEFDSPNPEWRLIENIDCHATIDSLKREIGYLQDNPNFTP